MLRIFNTLTKQKELFNPIDIKIVNIYVCGITVYDYCHIGHARTFTAFDMIIRYLQYLKYNTNYVRNITDIDDKIIYTAKKNKEDYYNLTNRMIFFMKRDFKKLGLLDPNFEPRVTDHISDIIHCINILIGKKFGYIANNGDVIFSVNHYQNYGELSKQNINKLKFSQDSNIFQKKCTQDFVLWKRVSKIDTPNWDSPWGFGRPGWHIECSTFNHIFFGKNLDIHGGGSDLLFPHHENERAQSSALYNKNTYGKYWIHIGSILVNNNKMSKSLNNTVFLYDILKNYNSEIIRYFFLSTHYRKPISFDEKKLYKAIFDLKKLYTVLNFIKDRDTVFNKTFSLQYQHFCAKFFDAMNNDFNTPHAISVLFALVKQINIHIRKKNKNLYIQLIYQLKFLANIIGLLNQHPQLFLNSLNEILKR
ncbi:cysteine--tRNA ligase [Buchnera aphidicola]|uniref:cysteine--tRNA ligase n=1 Tax=Buchnera aphidicola TaxID=9 RepID=UPI0031B8B2EA